MDTVIWSKIAANCELKKTLLVMSLIEELLICKEQSPRDFINDDVRKICITQVVDEALPSFT